MYWVFKLVKIKWQQANNNQAEQRTDKKKLKHKIIKICLRIIKGLQIDRKWLTCFVEPMQLYNLREIKSAEELNYRDSRMHF